MKDPITSNNRIPSIFILLHHYISSTSLCVLHIHFHHPHQALLPLTKPTSPTSLAPSPTSLSGSTPSGGLAIQPHPHLKFHILLASLIRLLHWQPFGSNTPSPPPPYCPAYHANAPPLSDQRPLRIFL